MSLLDGKKALITGVANKRSIAWGIAQAFHRHGAEIAFTCLESNVGRLKRLADKVESDVIVPCDALKDEQITQAAQEVGQAFQGELDILVHSIAFADIGDLGGEFLRV